MVLLARIEALELGDGLDQELRPDLRQPLGQPGRVISDSDRDLVAVSEDWTMVQLLVHLHDRDAGELIPGQDGVSHRRRTPPPGQQGGVDVEHAVGRQLQDRAGDDLAVGHDHDQFGRRSAQSLDR